MGFVVEIDVQNTISNLTNIETFKLRICVDMNDQDEIVRILVIVNDERTAKKTSAHQST